MGTSSISYDEFADKTLALVNKQNVARATSILRIAFWTLSALLLLHALWFAISSLIATPAQILEIENKLASLNATAGQNNVTNKSVSDREIALLEKTEMFGEFATAQPEPEPEAAPEKKSELHLELIGTFVSPGTSQAIIEDQKKKTQEVFQVGEEIFDQAKLTKIMPNKVEIEHGGQKEFLIIDENSIDGGEGSSDASADDEFVIDEGELNEALDNLPLLLTQARAVPYFKNGKAVGLRLFAIKTGSMYEKIGLKNGDILKSINDNSLADMSQAMKLFEKLREERSLSVVLERNRQEKRFSYSIR